MASPPWSGAPVPIIYYPMPDGGISDLTLTGLSQHDSDLLEALQRGLQAAGYSYNPTSKSWHKGS